ncbi:anti-sigma-E factor RseA [Candidatus Pantoea persica]|uniref:anti-sigma-E factor RseA n=1 Tax=Candidatus Pantoea persica TaxID=2518128 RepID=UPI00215DAB44|nr:anti-sigma-E factor RseA [Candidatus Pantoea persica]MBA2817234.1 Sigma-E factor negative regulatory protein [Candidatus Pantoea persica]
MQKEQLSALMDGKVLDNALLSELSQDAELQQCWTSYHLIRDTLRGDVRDVLHFDISARVAEALEQEPVRNVTTLIPEAKPNKMLFWRKARPWAAQLTQIGVAACVSLAVIVGVQHYTQPSGTSVEPSDAPVFNTLPMMGKASMVSLGVPFEAFDTSSSSQQVQDQRRRVNADYELQRRLYSDRLQFETNAPQQAQANAPGNQSLGIQQQ